MTNTQINQLDYTAYQPNMLLDFHFSYEKDIAADDISRTVSEAVEGACLIKYVSFKNRNAHGYDRIMMLKLVLLAIDSFRLHIDTPASRTMQKRYPFYLYRSRSQTFP